MKWLFVMAGLAALAGGGPLEAQHEQHPPNALTPAEKAAGWQLLFDGKTTTGWRGYQKTDMPAGWKVIDGALTLVGEGGDIVVTREFADFELALEWKVSPKGNSGIFYRGTEAADAIFRTAPEMQVLDDAGHPDGQSPLTSAGSVFGLYPAVRGVVKPAGEWNQVRIKIDGDQVEHWLNGIRVAEYRLGSADWLARVKDSKFAAPGYSGYGKAKSGLIGLQDHGDRVAFRSIRIKPLP